MSRAAQRVKGRTSDSPGLEERVAALDARVAELEEDVAESRRLNQRLADVIDVVTEVLVPAADRDDDRMQRAVRRLNATLQSGPKAQRSL